MKEKVRLRKWVKVVIALIIVIVLGYLLYSNFNKDRKSKTTKQVQTIKKEEKPVKTEINSVLEGNDEIQENVVEEPQEEIYEEPSNTYETRMTSFWADDGYRTGECTGSGLCSWDFDIDEHGWYTYQGKLVIATATTYLANQGWYVADGVHLRQYGDEVTLVIDGVEYDAIVKDSCGNCMKTDRVDLFVSNGESARDTYITVKEK